MAEISMVNTRGRVVWVEERRIPELRDQGWRIIVNPKETYYPQFDQTTGTAKEDEIGSATKVVENDNYSDQLKIIVL